MSNDPRLPVDELAERLAEIYDEAERKLDALITAAAARGATGTARYYENQRAAVASVMRQLEKARKPLSASLVPYAYRTGVSAVDRVLEKEKTFSGVHTAAMEVLSANLDGHLRYAEERIGRAADRAVHDAYHGQGFVRQAALEEVAVQVAAGVDPRTQAIQLEDRLRKEGMTAFVDKRGRRWRLPVYARMVTRTLTREAVSVGMKNRLIDHGQELVEISKHAGSCKICLPFQGRTFSLTGASQTYPLLEDLPPFHPNCRHVLIPAKATFEAVEEALGLGPGPGSMAPATTPEAPKEAIGTGDDGIPKTKLTLRNLIFDTEASDTWSPKDAFDYRDEPDYHENTLYHLGQLDEKGDKYALATALGDEISDKAYGFDPLQAQVDRHFTEKQARTNDLVTVYRAVEPQFAGKPILPGAFVTESRGYAELHGEGPLGGNYVIEEMEVRPSELYTQGSPHEFHYTPSLDDGWDRIVEWRKRNLGTLSAFMETSPEMEGTETAKLVEATVKKMDRVVGAPAGRPNLKLVAFDKRQDPATKGAYTPMANLLEIRDFEKGERASRTYTTAHEIGHYIDYGLVGDDQIQAFAGGNARIARQRGASDYADDVSKDPSLLGGDAKMIDVVEALRATSVATSARAVAKDTARYTASDRKYVRNYYLSPRELFARGFAEWIAIRTNDKELLAGMRSEDDVGGALNFVIPEDEFRKDVAPKYDALFADRGLLNIEPEVDEDLGTIGESPVPDVLLSSSEAEQAERWGITPAEFRTLSNYYNGGSARFNMPLRGHPEGIEQPAGPDEIALMDSALEKMSRYSPVILFRGIHREGLSEAEWKDLRTPGKIFRDRGYTSTSIDPGMARVFASDEEESAVLKIETGGRGAAKLNTVEAEYLIGRGARFEVMEVAPKREGQPLQITVRLLAPDEKTPDELAAEERERGRGWTSGYHFGSALSVHQRETLEWAGNRIDKVLRKPDGMPLVSVPGGSPPGVASGSFEMRGPPPYDPGDPILRYRENASPWTVVHELGHFLDRAGWAGSMENWAEHPTEIHNSADGGALMEAINGSQRITELRERSPESMGIDFFYKDYLLRGGEMFARAFAQYVATKNGEQDSLAAYLDSKDKALGPLFSWTEEDFKPIEEKFDAFFEREGWKRPDPDEEDLERVEKIEPIDNGLNIIPSSDAPVAANYPGEPRPLNGEEAEAVKRGLTPEQARAGNNYTSALSAEINATLRLGRPGAEKLFEPIGTPPEYLDEAEASVPFMDTLIESKGLDRPDPGTMGPGRYLPDRVTHGVDWARLSKDDRIAMTTPGVVMRERGFTSATSNPAVAEAFGRTTYGLTAAEEDPPFSTVFDFTVPPDSPPALDVTEWFSGAQNQREGELIFGRNLRYRIDEVIDEPFHPGRPESSAPPLRRIKATILPPRVPTPAEERTTEILKTLPQTKPDQRGVETMDDLYEMAEETKDPFRELLDEGGGVEARLGADALVEDDLPKFEEEAAALAADEKPVVVIAPLKRRATSEDKLKRKGYGPEKLTDINRASILVRDLNEVPKAVEALVTEAEERGWTVQKPENFLYGDETKEGYRDLAVLLVSPEGHVTEVQIHVNALWEAKFRGGGHELYQQVRAIDESVGDRRPTGAEMKERTRLVRKMWRLYLKAYNEVRND